MPLKRAATRADANSVRHWNESVVIHALRSGGEQRISEICRRTGLTPASAGQVARGLEAKGWIDSRTPAVVGPGRPAQLLSLRRPEACVVGLDVGAHAVRGVRLDMSDDVAASTEERLPPGAQQEQRSEAVARVLDHLIADAPPVWLTTLAVGGYLRPDGLVVRSVAIPEWDGLHPAELFRDLLPSPGVVLNDVRAATLAEHLVGGGQGFDDVLVAQLGRRPTLGHLIDGEPRRGAHGTAGDLSLSTLVPTEEHMDWLAPFAGSLDPLGDGVRAALAGDEATLAGAVRYVESITPALTFAASIIDPGVFVVAGALSPLASHFMTGLQDSLEAHLQEPPATRLSPLDQFSTAHGAALSALRRIDATLISPTSGAAPLTRTEFITRLGADPGKFP